MNSCPYSNAAPRFGAIVVALFLLLCLPARAQKIVLDNRYTVPGQLELTEEAACRDAQGNIYETGISGVQRLNYQPGSAQMVTQKFSPSGSVLWTSFFSEPPSLQCYPSEIVVGANGDTYVAGYAKDFNAGTQLLLVHISPSGSTVWNVLNPAVPASVGLALDTSGNPIVAGLISNSTLQITKYSASNSQVVWQDSVNLPAVQNSAVIAGDANGHLYSLAPLVNGESDVRSYDESTGATHWTQELASYGAFTNYVGQYLTVMASGAPLISGEISSKGSNPFQLATLDLLSSATGSPMYRKTIGAQSSGYQTGFACPPASTPGNEAAWVTVNSPPNALPTDFAGKSSTAGNIEWYDPVPFERQYVLAATAAGGLYLCPGETSAPRTIISISAVGKILWAKTSDPVFDPSNMGSLITTTDSGVAFCCTSRDSYSNTSFSFLALKATDGSTEVFAQARPSGMIDDPMAASDRDQYGNIYVLGTENNTLYAAKLTPMGAVIWRTPIGAQFAFLKPLAISYSGGYLAAVGGGAQAGNLLAAKLNATTGAVAWVQAPGIAQGSAALNAPFPVSAGLDSAGNVDVCYSGLSFSPPFTMSGAVQMSSATGAVNWNVSGQGNSAGQIAVDSQGDVYSASYTTGANPGFFLQKISPAGQVLFAKTEPTGVNVFSTAVSLAFNPTTSQVFLACPLPSSQGGGEILCDLFDPGGNMVGSTTVILQRDDPTNEIYASYSAAANAFYVFNEAIGTNPIYPSTLGALIVKVSANGDKWDWDQEVRAYDQEDYLLTGWTVDRFGNPTVAVTTSTTPYFLNRVILRKFDATTGYLGFWSTTYQGAYASGYNTIGSLSVGPDGQVTMVGSTPSATGPGAMNGLVVKFADTNPPICANDSYACLENQALNPAAPSVFTNDQDVAGATCLPVSNPKHAASFSLNPTTGKVSYTPVTGFVGTDAFSYRATNAYGVSNVATATITVVAH